MIKNITQKEFISALRDKRLVIAGTLVLIMLVTATLTGFINYRILEQERTLAQHSADERWQYQPDRHPHRMAHYGAYAFRPKSVLSFLDSGIDPYTGSAVYLEAHHQNSANFSLAQQSGAILRFGEMTVAFVLQMLVPLLIIFLCFNAFTQERESGTIKILLSQGCTIKAIARAKIKGYIKVLSLIIFPGLLIAASFLFYHNGPVLNADMLLRLLIFIVAYCIYFYIFIVTAVIVSALCHRSSNALIILLGIWIMACIILPRATANAGERWYTAPNKAEMDAQVHADATQGIDGHDSQNKRNELLIQSLLKKYKADSVSQLPLNIEGILMAAGETYSSRIYDQHFYKLMHIYQQQNNVSAWAGIIDPYLSLRFVSMAASGADFQHYIHFLQAAEKYRYTFVQRLNDLQATQLAHKDKNFRLSSNTWKTFPMFTYSAPGIQAAMRPHIAPVTALLVWGILIWFVGNLIINQIKPL